MQYPAGPRATTPKDLTRRTALLLLIAVLLIGAGLRLRALDRPAVWGDEALTYSRVMGTYGQLLDILRSDGFMPLHYQAYWWLAQGCPLPWPTGEWHEANVWSPGGEEPWLATPADDGSFEQWQLPLPEVGPWPLVEDGILLEPFYLRLIPAALGTLTVPAMYLLAVQLTSRRTAVIVALFAATSAYLLNYSRDAKMYMQTWFFVTIHVACLLWWLRMRAINAYSRPAWYLWVATGIGMVGSHAVSAVVLAVEVVIAATYATPRPHRWTENPLMLAASVPAAGVMAWARGRGEAWRWWRSAWNRTGVPTAVPFVLGLAVIGSAMLGYYGTGRVPAGEDKPWYHVAGFNRWAPARAQSDEEVEQAWRGGSGLTWIEGYNADRDFPGHVAFALTSYLHSWEWPKPTEHRQINPWVLTTLQGVTVTLAGLALFGLASRPVRLGRDADRHVGDGRLLLWLGFWVAVPVAVFWWISRGDRETFMPPAWWLGVAAALSGATLYAAAASDLRTRLLRLARVSIPVGLLAVVVLWGVRAAIEASGPVTGGSIFMPRYLGFVWPAFAVGLVVLLMRLPHPWLRWGAVALLVGVNLVQYAARLDAGTEPPTPLIAADVSRAHGDPATRMVWRVRRMEQGDGNVNMGAPATGVAGSFPHAYYAQIADPQPVAPNEFRGWWGMRHLMPGVEVRAGGPRRLAGDVARRAADPGVTRLIVWTSYSPRREEEGPQPDDATITEALGDPWRLTSDHEFHVRDHWTWQEWNTLRRRVWERVDSESFSADLTSRSAS